MKLYEVHGSIVVYVVAKDSAEAARIAASDVPRTEPENMQWYALAVKSTTKPLFWGPACLVYGADRETTLADAVKRYVEVAP